jgi:hypothetical protein
MTTPNANDDELDTQAPVSCLELLLGLLAARRRRLDQERRERHATRRERARMAAQRRRESLRGAFAFLGLSGSWIALFLIQLTLVASVFSALTASDETVVWDPWSPAAASVGLAFGDLPAIDLDNQKDMCLRYRAGSPAFLAADDLSGCMAAHPQAARALRACPQSVCRFVRVSWGESMRWILLGQAPASLAPFSDKLRRLDWMFPINAAKSLFCAFFLLVFGFVSARFLGLLRALKRKGARHFWAMLVGSNWRSHRLELLVPAIFSVFFGVFAGVCASSDAVHFLAFSTAQTIALSIFLVFVCAAPLWLFQCVGSDLPEPGTMAAQERLDKFDALMVDGRRLAERAALSRVASAAQASRPGSKTAKRSNPRRL